MRRACDSCGQPYEAKRATSRYCKDAECARKRSRERMQSSRRGESTPAPPRLAVAERPTVGRLLEAVREELESLGVLDTTRGEHALTLAGCLYDSTDTGSSIAAVSKEFRAVMEEIRSNTPAKANPLDQLRERRERKLAAG